MLDEADEMLDMGFAEDIDAIIAQTPDTRQTALFAATMAPRIAAIAGRHLKHPSRVTIAHEKRAAGKLPRIRQIAYVVGRPQKMAALGRILDFENPKSAIVFCRTRIEVDELSDTLKAHGFGAQALHGGMEQRQRDRVMQSFRKEQADILVATDVAARGLDIEHVSHVINFDVPTSPEVYVHRIGRTGRIGREGVAITLAKPREQRFLHIGRGADQAEDRRAAAAERCRPSNWSCFFCWGATDYVLLILIIFVYLIKLLFVKFLVYPNKNLLSFSLLQVLMMNVKA